MVHTLIEGLDGFPFPTLEIGEHLENFFAKGSPSPLQSEYLAIDDLRPSLCAESPNWPNNMLLYY